VSYDLGTAHGKIEIDYDGARAVRAAKDDVEDLGRKAKRADDPVKKLSTNLGKLGKSLGKGAGITALALGLTSAGVQAGAATVQILGMVPALASVGSLAAGLPALFVGVGAGVGVAKAALAGFDDVMKAAFSTAPKDTEKFNEALKKLAPSAQAFAKSFKSDLVPGLRAFQQGIQQAFFSNNLQSLFPSVQSAIGQLSPVVQSLATQFAGVAKTVAGFATSSQTIEFVRNSVETFRNSIDNLRPAILPVLEGLRSVGLVGSSLMERLSNAVGGAAQRFGAWMSDIANSGQLEGWIDQAIATLSSLRGIISNVGRILGSVFGAAEATGGGLLNTLEELTGQVARFLNSAEGSALLREVFGALLTVARQLAPVFGTLVTALGGALAPVLKQLATEIGPVLLQAVQQLAPAFGPLAGAIGDLLSAVAPLLPSLARFVAILATLIGSGVSALASEFGPVVAILGDAFLQALQALQPVLSSLITQALPQAAALGAQLAQAFAPLAPVIVQTAQAFASAILPVLPQVIGLLVQLTPVIVAMAEGFVTMLTIGLRVAAWLATFGAAVVGMVASAVSAFINFRSQVVGAFQAAYNLVVSVGAALVAWFTALPGRIGSALAALPGTLLNLIKSAVSNAAFAFGAGIGLLVSFAANLPGRVASAISSLISTLKSIATSAWNAARSAFASGVSAVVGFVKTAPGRIRSAIAALPGLLRSAAVGAMNAFRSAISSGINSAVSLARGIAGRIRSAVGNLGSALVGAGRDAVLGLANGIRGAVGAAVSAAASVGRQVIAGVKSTLRIKSPSRVMEVLGRFVNQGLVNGLLGTAKQVQAAANKVANLVRDAYSAGAIGRGKRNALINGIANANRALQKLVAQGNSVTARLKTAQANLKSVQDAYNKTAADARAKVLDSFSLVQPGENFISIERLKARLTKAVAVAKQFASDMAKLSKRGLNQNFLSQLASAGAVDGGAMAKALANASDADIKQLNVLQGQLNTAAGSVGKNVADALYGAGVRAAQGLVKGLQSQQKAIDKQMAKIAAGLAANIKKALKIKSPSRVFFALGRFISQGLINGITSLRKQVGQAANKLATSAMMPTVNLGATSPYVPRGGDGASLAAPAASGVVVNQTVNALPGMSARQVANYGASRMSLMFRTGTIAVATTPPPSQEA